MVEPPHGYAWGVQFGKPWEMAPMNVLVFNLGGCKNCRPAVYDSEWYVVTITHLYPNALLSFKHSQWVRNILFSFEEIAVQVTMRDATNSCDPICLKFVPSEQGSAFVPNHVHRPSHAHLLLGLRKS